MGFVLSDGKSWRVYAEEERIRPPEGHRVWCGGDRTGVPLASCREVAGSGAHSCQLDGVDPMQADEETVVQAVPWPATCTECRLGKENMRNSVLNSEI